MIFQINCMTDLINISIQSDFNFVGDIYVSMIKSRNNHILLTIALLLGQVIKKEVNTTIQVMNILLPMGGMVTHWLMSQQNKPTNTTSMKKTALYPRDCLSNPIEQHPTPDWSDKTYNVYSVYYGKPLNRAKVLMMYGSIIVTIQVHPQEMSDHTSVIIICF